MAKSEYSWSLLTPMLLFSCFCLLTGDLLFGYDTASFGGILANPGFVRQFGAYDPKNKIYSFDPHHVSLLSSIPFIGKFLGCLLAGPAIEKLGHRAVFMGLSVVSCIGIIIELTAAGTGVSSGRLAQFITGRVVVYIAVGLVEVNVTTYQAEIVPAAFRGFVIISLQLFLNAGTVLATGVNKAFAKTADSTGWKTVTGIQFIFPVLIMVFTVFIPSSPRWLLSKGREQEAAVSLRRLRAKGEDADCRCDAEIQSIKEALQDSVYKAPWTDLIRGTNLRRTTIVMVYYFFQQTTGQAFVSTYQTTFYKQNGYADQSFTYPVINSCLSMLSVIPAMYLVDRLGRRITLMNSFLFQAFWMFLLAGLGEKTNKTPTEKNTIVAAFMLYAFVYNMGGASIPYLLGAEIPNAALREKTQALGASWNVLWAFATNYSIPYMIAKINFQIGWVFGSIAILGFVFTLLVLPETKGASLEEVDAIFEVSFDPFRPNTIHGIQTKRRVEPVESLPAPKNDVRGAKERWVEEAAQV